MMLCTNGHNNPDDAMFCTACGVNTFQPKVMVSGAGLPTPQGNYNGLAIASMVLGILWLYFLGSALALVFGWVARKQIKERGQRGGGMAIAGIVLGSIGVFFLVIAIIGAAVTSNSPLSN